MDRILRFKRHFSVEPLDEERYFLIGEEEHVLFQGRVHALVAPLIDGRRTVGELIALLADRVSAPEVFYVLSRLKEKGYLVEVSRALAPEVEGFWESLGSDAAQAATRLTSTTVNVRAVGTEDPRPLIEALEAAGITVGPEADVCVVMTPDYLTPEMDAWSREARPGTRWMAVKAAGTECWFGPMLGAPAAACWACLAVRLRDNRPVEEYLRQRRGGVATIARPRVGLRASAAAGLHCAALALARWIVDGCKGALDRHLMSFHAGDLRLERHVVARRPQCSVCGDPGITQTRALAPIALSSRPKRFTADGGHRCVTPEETVTRYQDHISRITGVVSDLRPVGDNNSHRQVYNAIFPVRPSTTMPSGEDFHRVAGGKGRTAAQARAGALCEAIERYSAVFRGDEYRLRARLSELGGAAIHPNALQGYSAAQYRQRGVVDLREDPQRVIPLPYDGDAIIEWTPVWSLTHQRRRYVPTSYCYLYTPTPPEEQFTYFNSNGNAAGNCPEEAILQGFLELVERDAVAVWWYNRIRRPGVDLRSFDEPYFLALEDYFGSIGLRLQVVDITHDLEIPTFVAVAWAPDTGRIWAGCGSHFDARLAVQRALTEVNQCLNPRDLTRSPWEASTLEDLAYLLPDEAAAARGRHLYPEHHREDLRDDVQDCVDRAARVGLETLVLDQTRPDVGLCAVKVIVPGLRHFWPRLGPGRLYEVPVRMGWLRAPLEEAQLNPVPFVF
ncbi:TOMM precursor leader peptide-binding protein [Sorangium sp. So ce448]|uniref:TOMM precursor leader peptide-binding protein n=1 Tax=Sorangium sp. So ce448 TaxID=3133314 RepID=UPI003F5ED2EA